MTQTSRRRRQLAGSMLIDVMAAMMVFGLASAGVLSSYLALHDLINDSREVQVAMDDLRDVAERIHMTSFGTLDANFPAGVSDYSAVTGAYLLNNQAISVAYPVDEGDLVEIVVTLTWDHGTRQRSLSLSTVRTST